MLLFVPKEIVWRLEELIGVKTNLSKFGAHEIVLSQSSVVVPLFRYILKFLEAAVLHPPLGSQGIAIVVAEPAVKRIVLGSPVQ
ncbi:hypothetical protein D3C85_958490 [compost metagenome]